MIITGGHMKGRKLADIGEIRPTQSKVRQAVFNMMPVGGRRFCDLFAGSGMMGFEALSRGAVSAVFVDHRPECQPDPHAQAQARRPVARLHRHHA